MKRFFSNIFSRITGLRKDCQGFVVVSTLAIFLFLFVLCASIYAVGETIHQRIKLQNACDAAAYSAAVVQADGLSRMACVNRAMAWSYVQMTNRQMDYITYRWLKLTCKRFDEDKTNARDYNEQLIMAVDKELGAWAILEAALTGLISAFFDFDCAGLKDGKVSDVWHRKEGHGWWCGLENVDKKEGDRKKHNIRLNVVKDADGIAEKAKNAVVDGIGNMIFTREMLDYILTPLGKIIDKDDTPAGWGEWLGKLIDYDKKNITRMNNALGRINKQMTISMKMTAESVLKASLKDNRFDSNNVLKDYYISIHIPEASNPYDAEHRTQAPSSFFSPLRNTEADEMLFLNMVSSESADKNLYQHFPTLLGGDSLAFGLDQWFIRGTAAYSDGKDHSSDGKLTGVSFAIRQDPRNGFDDVKSTTYRDEGALGIQRVYKDTNLNETRAGFFSQKPKTVTKTIWGGEYADGHWRNKTVRNDLLAALQPCCLQVHKELKGKLLYVPPHNHTITENVIEEESRAIYRGNHLMDFTNVTNAVIDATVSAAKDLFGKEGSSSGTNNADDDEGGFLNDVKKRREELLKERAEYEAEMKTASPARQLELRKKIGEIDAALGSINSSFSNSDNSTGIGIGVGSNTGNGSGEIGDSSLGSSVGNMFSSIGNTITNGLKTALGNLIGNYLDIQPSCGNDPKLSYQYFPMCQAIKDPTTALYSEYRWGSCKWYCLTKAWTYFVCSSARLGLFDTDYEGIYCDRARTQIAEFPLLLVPIPVYGSGWGHLGWPKCFCGARPVNSFGTEPPDPDDPYAISQYPKRLANIPPPLLPINISGAKHGYMESPIDFIDGFMTPIKPLWDEDSRYFSRDAYKSCAMFIDGLVDVNPLEGHKAWPGLIRGHARIYADDKDIFDNRYVGAKCKPWVLNERFFAGDGSIVIGAAMKHTNPFVQLFNFLNTKKSGENDGYRTGTDKQKGNETTVLSAFNIPENNYMWTMSAARAGVRRLRRNGAFDQERQYQITYDSTSDVENLAYVCKYLFNADQNQDSGTWIGINNTGDAASDWSSKNPENKNALSRIHFSGQTQTPIWNGCPCTELSSGKEDDEEKKEGYNFKAFKNLWNLCETDWDATLLPVRYAGQRATLLLSKGSGSKDLEGIPLNDQDYQTRTDLIKVNYELPDADNKNVFEKNDRIFGRGSSWTWNGVATNLSTFVMSNPFINAKWKKANASFFENLVLDHVPGQISTGISTWNGLNLQTEIPEGKEKKKINVYQAILDRIL